MGEIWSYNLFVITHNLRVCRVLFPGGDADLTSNTGYAQVGRYVFEIANEMNKNGTFGLSSLIFFEILTNKFLGEYFPLWGTCLGFELLLRLGNNDQNPLTPCSAQGIAQKLNIQTNNSRLLNQADNQIRRILSTENIAANFHHFCVLTENFTDLGLNNDWKILSTNKDMDGLEFVSAVEHKHYPYYAVQFHPEKNVYEWPSSKAILHTRNAIKASQFFAEFFVDEARQSTHSFKTKEDANRYLIYNWSPVFAGRNESSTLMQIYRFSEGEGFQRLRRISSETT